MTEYIEREKLKEALCPYSDTNYAQDMDTILRIVDEFPAADVAPVVHGRWNKDGRCSNCGGHAPFLCMASTYHKSLFCPECGAKMDLE